MFGVHLWEYVEDYLGHNLQGSEMTSGGAQSTPETPEVLGFQTRVGADAAAACRQVLLSVLPLWPIIKLLLIHPSQSGRHKVETYKKDQVHAVRAIVLGSVESLRKQHYCCLEGMNHLNREKYKTSKRSEGREGKRQLKEHKGGSDTFGEKGNLPFVISKRAP